MGRTYLISSVDFRKGSGRLSIPLRDPHLCAEHSNLIGNNMAYVKEKFILTLVKMLRKILFRTIAIDFKTIPIEEIDKAQS